MSQFTVSVPAGVAGGDALAVTNPADGSQMMTTVPASLKEGDTFTVLTGPAVAPIAAVPAGQVDIEEKVRTRGALALADAAAYTASMPQDAVDAATEGCRAIYWPECCGTTCPIGWVYNKVCCDCCLWTPVFVWFNPLVHVGPLICLCHDDAGGWIDNKRKLRLKVVDAERGTLACYHSVCSGDLQPMCWCTK